MIKTTSILPGETLFDVAVRDYGHMQGVFQLAKDNGIGMTDELAPGGELEVDESISFKELRGISIALQTVELPNEVAAEPYQNMFDIAVQLYGDLSGVFQLAKDNSKDMTTELLPGEVLKSRKEVINKLIVDYYRGRNIKPATGLSPEENEQLKPEGIDYWAIEVDFIVS
jgi:hypothetical protein